MLVKDIPRIMIECLLITIFIEVLLALILGVRSKKDFINIVLVNVIVNPIVVIIPIAIYIYFGVYHQVSVLIVEQLSIIVEGMFYYKYLDYKKINSFVLSLILNIVSFGVCQIINLWMF